MFKVAVDLGYGYTKAINERREEVVFRSIVSPVPVTSERTISGLLGVDTSTLANLHVRFGESSIETFYVGELAERNSELATFTLDENKIVHPYTKVLLWTALGLLTPESESSVFLATGLPLRQYDHQKDLLHKTFLGKATEIEFIGGPKKGKRQSMLIDQILVYPQALAGAMAFLHSPEANEHEELAISGALVGFVDVGYKTTDFLVFQTTEESFLPREDLMGTLDVGMSSILHQVEEAFIRRTGSVPTRRAVDTVINTGRIFWRGQEYVFEDVMQNVKHTTAQVVLDGIKRIWAAAGDVRKVFLMGGGGIAFHEAFKAMDAETVLIENAQMANARGYLLVAEQAVTSPNP